MKNVNSKRAVVIMALASLIFVTTGCSSSTEPAAQTSAEPVAEATPEPAATYKDGDYEGVGKGVHGEVKVAVKVAGGQISEVKVISHNETEGVGSVAVDMLPGEIVNAQSANVEMVSGATVTSKAIADAVNSALDKAK